MKPAPFEKEATLEARLKMKQASIHEGLDRLGVSVADEKAALKDRILKNPAVGLGGALVGGVLVGLIFGGSKKDRPHGPRRKNFQAAQAAWTDSASAEIQKRLDRGDAPVEAVKDALRHVPMVVQVDAAPPRLGLVRDVATQTLRHVLGTAMFALVSKYLIKEGMPGTEQEAVTEATEE